MIENKAYEFWFVTGSQHLYGMETLQKVEEHSKQMVQGLNEDRTLTSPIVFKSVLTTADEIYQLVLDANSHEYCAGIITWMHTFSPAKMWIAGLSELKKPLVHLHTQYNRDIPWESIDMDFMNLNQSAHGDREFGFIGARMNIPRKVVAGYWESPNVRERLAKWMHTAIGYSEGKHLKIARFGDNMRSVAVTEGDKIEAQIQLGWTVDGYGVGDLVEYVNSVPKQAIDELLDQYFELYEIPYNPENEHYVKQSIREQARMEIGLKSFLKNGGYTAFTTTFEDLHGLKQLPGLAVQRLMAEGYGFGGEGDWKTAALLRVMKVMANGEATSFMEDYTYHFEPNNEFILGSHMLEVCPSIAATRPKLQVHPLSIGGKEDPARLVFDGKNGTAIVVSIIDLGKRFRLIVNEIEAIRPMMDMPNLPVARVLWKPSPNLTDSTESWIIAGGAHHTVFSLSVRTEQLIDWAEMIGMECVVINEHTNPLQLRNQIKISDLAWSLR